ncbi:MAG: RNA 2',3'-cyclic phosphodiesterase [Silvibacterium sp.]|nr:RNA 2',3'-cyclic phosphodiesterase [Silvibacterium sp.]
MRLFIGIGLPGSVAETLAKSATKLLPSSASKLRWTPPANMHITLSFLGQVHEARRKVIEQALFRVRAPRMQLELAGIGVFERVGVLFAEVKHTPALLALGEQVAVAMERCGFAREDRSYSPHVTLARTRERLHLRPDAADDPAFHQTFEATDFRLYQSLTLPGGAQYNVLRSFPLD